MSNPYASQQRAALEKAPPQAAEGYALVEIARRMDEAARNPDDGAANWLTRNARPPVKSGKT